MGDDVHRTRESARAACSFLSLENLSFLFIFFSTLKQSDFSPRHSAIVPLSLAPSRPLNRVYRSLYSLPLPPPLIRVCVFFLFIIIFFFCLFFSF